MPIRNPLRSHGGLELGARDGQHPTHVSPPARAPPAVGFAMRTKMSCSDGRVTSKCRTRARATSAAQERLRIAGQPHFLQLPVVVDRLDARQRRRARRRARRCARAPCRCRTPPGSRRSVPSSTLRPRKIMKMRSHIRSATSMSCVLKTMVVPRRRSRAPRREHVGVDRVEAGERLVEDQQRRARETTAAMNWTFCDMPFESASIGSIEPRARGSFGQSTYRSRNR